MTTSQVLLHCRLLHVNMYGPGPSTIVPVDTVVDALRDRYMPPAGARTSSLHSPRLTDAITWPAGKVIGWRVLLVSVVANWYWPGSLIFTAVHAPNSRLSGVLDPAGALVSPAGGRTR